MKTFFILGLLISGKVLAVCSPYWGLVTINEAGKVGFVELKLLLTSIPQSEYQNWQVRSCRRQGNKNVCSSFIPVGSPPLENGTYLRVFTSALPNNEPFDVILVDGNGDTIDYLSVGGFLLQQDPTCTPYYDWTAPLVNSSHDFHRLPDGTGDWGDAGPGASGGDTGGDTNDVNSPIITVNDITLNKGELATFTFSIPAAETANVSVDYVTVNGSASAGTHYTTASGTATIPAGSTSTTISVATIASSPNGTVIFYLQLTGAVNGTPSNHFPSATLLDVLIDHIEISHDGGALTCSPEIITIRACEDASCSTVASTDVTVTLSSSSTNSVWSQNPVTIPANSTLGVNVELTNRTPETVTLNASSSPTANNAAICSPNCNLPFAETGFVLTLPDHSSCSTPNLIIQALQINPTGDSCAPAYIGNQTVGFAYDYLSPATGSVIPQVSSTNLAASPASVQTRVINFDNSATATLPFQYNDAGQLTISVSDLANAGLTSSSVNAVARPSQFLITSVDVNADCATNDANCSVFKKAGEDFNLTVTAACADPINPADPVILTPNFIGDVNLSVNTVAPLLGNPVTLAIDAITFSNTDNGVHDESTQNISEVGVFTISATADNYFGSNLPSSTSASFGRFIPDHFVITQPSVADACTGFTYGGYSDGVNLGLDRDGQSFVVNGTISARNTLNNVTANYTNTSGGFDKLITSQFSTQAFNTNTAAVADGQFNFSTTISFVNGISNYNDTSAHYQYESIAAPIDLRLDITATDSDGVTNFNNLAVNSNVFNLRLGRLVLTDSYGPETEALEMPLVSEYFDGNSWITNADDSCSSFINSRVSFDLSSYTDNLADGETTATSPSSSTNLSSGVSLQDNGLWFSAPGINNYGTVEVNFDLTPQGWLRFDWDADNTIENTTNARLNFGYYRGSDRVIYWQEQ